MITGASKGYGLAISMAYAEEGADLYLYDFEENATELKHVAQKVRDAVPGRRVATGTFDIVHAEAVKEMVKDILGHYERIDVLLNTTACGWHGKFFECTEAEFGMAIDRGLKAYFLTCQHIGKEMARRCEGKIINITSIVGRLGPGGAVPWAIARSGVDSLIAAAAQALGQYGIRCAELARGNTAAPDLTSGLADKSRDDRLSRMAIPRLGTIEDLIGPAVFLASAESDWVTGTILYADGGYSTGAAFDDKYRAEEISYRRP